MYEYTGAMTLKRRPVIPDDINALFAPAHCGRRRRPFAAANCSNSASAKLSSNSGQRGDAASSNILNDQQHTSRKPVGGCFLCFRSPHEPALSKGKAMRADPRWFLARTER
jgi:hypothetical protein